MFPVMRTTRTGLFAVVIVILSLASACESTAEPGVRSASPPGSAPEGMVWIPGGVFWMGCADCGMPDALPLHLVEVDGFWMDRTPVTNAQFAEFIKATGYVTVAEQTPDPKDFPGAPLDMLVPGSAVFTQPAGDVPLDNHLGGGATSKAQAGKLLRVLPVTLRAGKTILWSTSRGTTLLLMPNGQASGCRPKLSSSSQLEGVSIASRTPGAMN